MVIETFTRIFVEFQDLKKSIQFHRELLTGKVTLRFPYPEKGLELAAVSPPHLSVLIIAGPAQRRAPFEATRVTVQVARLEPYLATLRNAGSEQLEPVQKTPVGRKRASATRTA